MSPTEFLQTFSDYMNATPSGLWTFLAALVAFIGISLQLRAHSKRESEQRTADMRRSALLAACEAVARSEEYVRRFWTPTLNENDLYELVKDFGPVILKIHVVGSFNTVEILGEYESKFVRACILVADHRLVVMARKMESDIAAERFSNYNNFLQEQQKTRPISIAEDTHFAVLRNESKLAREAKMVASLNAARECGLLADELAVLSLKFVQSTRKDLKFAKFPHERYSSFINSSVKDRQDQINGYIDKTMKGSGSSGKSSKPSKVGL